MAIYKNYTIKQGDTIESIAQKFLGSVSRAADIVSLNRLRSPYISDNVFDQLGPTLASGMLTSPLSAGDTSINLAEPIANGSISPSALSAQSVFYIETTEQHGAIIHDRMSVKLYYPYTVTEINKDNTTYSVIPAGTVKFDVSLIAPPSISAFDAGMISSIAGSAFIGSIQGTTLTVTTMTFGCIAVGMEIHGSGITAGTVISGYLSGAGYTGTYTINNSFSINEAQISASIPESAVLSARNYYIRYAYQTISGETLASPLRIEDTNGAAIPVALPNFSTGIRNLLVISAPLTWPDYITGVRIYIGSSPGAETYQGTLFSQSDILIEPITGFTSTSSSVRSINTAYIGLLHSYTIGTKYTFHDNPQALSTQVLTTGSVILLPTIVPPRSQLIVNNALTNQFIDALGTDIHLDNDGVISFNGNAGIDLTTVSGVKNVKQSIKGRLLTKLNDLKTQPAFGNLALNHLGAKYSANFLMIVRSAIIDSIKKEPRVSAINGMNISYNAQNASIIINNLSIKLTYDGTSASDIVFEPIALPI